MSWISLTVKDIALGAGPHVMWWLLEGIEPSFDARLSPGGGFRRAAEEKNGRKNDHLEPVVGREPQAGIVDLTPSSHHKNTPIAIQDHARLRLEIHYSARPLAIAQTEPASFGARGT